jgi:predicted GNAT family N-acyltransferase
MRFDIRSPECNEEYERYYALRWKLLREPWEQPRGSEKDDLENQSHHLMALDENGSPVAVARIHFNSRGEAQIRYMAVEPAYQGKRIGTRLLKKLEAHAQTLGATSIVLHARQPSVGFYEKSGYTVSGPAHILFGSIPHVAMRKRLGGNSRYL